ncbi:MAG: four helix bundle protein [Acidimicrobiia bacterium]
MRDYQNLLVWQRADALIPAVYAVARQLPDDERFGLASQLKRAAVSIASNIAEGSGRSSDADFERFLSIAAGSASEAEYQLGLVARMWPATSGIETAQRRANQIKRMLWGLMEASRQGRSSLDPSSEI